MTNEQWLEMYNEHINGLTVPQLSKKYEIHVQSFYTAFRRLNLKIIKRNPNRGGNYNHNFFDEIDSELKAYLLGWLASDEYITTKNRFGIKVHKKDSEIIMLFISSIAPGVKFYYEKNSIAVQFSSEHLKNALIKWGIIEHKTYKNTNIPKIKFELIRHYIRGYFEGDGSISIKKKVMIYICSINKQILNQMQKHIPITTKIYTENRSKHNWKDMHTLRPVGGKNSNIKFMKYMYENATYVLNRKYNLFLKLNQLYGNTEVIKESKESLTP